MSSKIGIALYKAAEFVCKLRHHLDSKNYKIMNFQDLWHWTSLSVTTRIKKRLAVQAACFEREEITLVGKMTFVWKMASSKLRCKIGYFDRFSRGFLPILAKNSGRYPNIVCDCCRPHNFQFNTHYNRKTRCPTVRATDKLLNKIRNTQRRKLW